MMNTTRQDNGTIKKKFIVASMCNFENLHGETRLLLSDSNNRQITATASQINNNHAIYTNSENKLLLLEGYWSETPWENHFIIREFYSSNQLTSKASEHQNIVLLITWLENLQPTLRKFITEIIESDLGAGLFDLPASHSHHHSHKGGLLAHSIECAIIAGQLALPTFPKAEAELTMVAAFLHDIGKCGTHNPQGHYSFMGNFISHDAYTLEALAPFLSTLNTKWALGAHMLRHMLVKDKSSFFPEFPGKLLVQLADQLSTSLDRRRSVFAGRPNNHYFAYDKNHNQKYLRIPV